GLASRRFRQAAVGVAVVVVVAVTGWLAPDGGDGPTIRTALVQGGGPRGFRATETDAAEVVRRHLAASAELRPPLDLVLWPEDVVDVEGPTRRAPEGAQLADVARRNRTTLVAGVVEGAGDDHFRNAALAWSPDGDLIGRYDKAKRVPFGEYVPLRGVVEDLVDLSAIPRDALAGSGPGLLRTPPADAGVLISYEVFFARRGRAAVRAGGDLLLVPTNAASFSTSQMPAQELAAARLRAIEAGRDLVQASPTGYSAYVDHRGRIRVRTALGRRAVVQRTVTLRTDPTVYVALGDWPLVTASVLALGGAWWLAGVPVSRRAWRARRPAGRRDGPGRTSTC
ncbi:MAG TPA: apolipoprotein N-acyltransferase, partial [Acidimicrobiales bacterium]|nr:apolipoprotein N-acyltransferase [Acidimicrobiales bacterium]